MGSTAMMVGGGLLGMSLAKSMSKSGNAGLTAYGSGAAESPAARPEPPAAPLAPEAAAGAGGGTAGGNGAAVTDNPAMEAERERERQAALLREKQAREIFTSGLGAAGLAATNKKTLLGG